MIANLDKLELQFNNDKKGDLVKIIGFNRDGFGEGGKEYDEDD